MGFPHNVLSQNSFDTSAGTKSAIGRTASHVLGARRCQIRPLSSRSLTSLSISFKASGSYRWLTTLATVAATLFCLGCSHQNPKTEVITTKVPLTDDAILHQSRFQIRLCSDHTCNDKALIAQAEKKSIFLKRSISNEAPIPVSVDASTYLSWWKKVSALTQNSKTEVSPCKARFELTAGSDEATSSTTVCRSSGSDATEVSHLVRDMDFFVTKRRLSSETDLSGKSSSASSSTGGTQNESSPSSTGSPVDTKP